MIRAATVTPPLGVVSVTTFSFAADASGGTDGRLSYDWEFPDGTTSKGQVVGRLFTAAGDVQVVLRVSNSAGTVSRSVPVGIATLAGKWESQGGGQTLRMVQVNDTFTGTYTSMTGLFNLLPVTLTVSPESPGTVDARGNFSAVFARLNGNGSSPSIRGRLLFTGVLEYKVDNAGPFINVQTGQLTRVSETP